ncbi:biotin transporter BioY [Galbitalea soli]|uniref:Biotin transporter n=1 Tax=Galbitalea soli TaxID=1268042 RepID=A0A7C9PMI9_9MICO|nr:biotin transporter BioY [Galbitalea soli]NEM90952.1 biotin transporter BioY [Galbitalea soli]NYJ29639.1 biotin transport system substrate-specific component [Galbitalea soli]
MTTRRPAALDLRDLARIVVFAAIIAVLGLAPGIPVFGSVPITSQTLGVMLAGTVLGAWRGAAAVLVVEVLVALGLPLLAGPRGGAGVFVGPSAGYLIGWIVGAFVIGAIARAGSRRPVWWRTAIACVVGGILVIYAIGIPVVSAVTHLPLATAAISSLAFVPGDLLKVVIATLITQALWRAYPAAFRRGRA